MTRINLVIEYNGNNPYDERMFEGIVKLNKCIDEIDDMFLVHTELEPIADEEEE